MSCNFIYVLAGFFVCGATRTAVLAEHRREEWPAYTLVVVVEALENQKSRYRHKDDSVSILHLISEHLVLFWSGFNNGCEVNKLLAFLGWDEVCFSFLPALLKFDQSVHEVLIILQLWVHTLDVFFVLAEQLPQRLEAFTNAFSQLTHSFGLTTGYTPAYAFSLE